MNLYIDLWIISQKVLLNIKKIKCIKHTENKKIFKIKKNKIDIKKMSIESCLLNFKSLKILC